MNTPATVYIVDDDASVRDSLGFILEGYGRAVAAYADGNAFLTGADLTLPGCAILDLRMPGLSGMQVHQALRERESVLGVIFLTGHGDVPQAVEALRHGACHFLEKPVESDSLLHAISAAQRVSLQRSRAALIRQRLARLTQRERQTFDLLCQGLKNQAVADRMHVSLRTVEVHRANISRKLETASLIAFICQLNAEPAGDICPSASK
uniref:Tetrathionate reductase complex response regulator n=1 Tax=Edwardsiella tarda TaxID=636 RepID=Q4ACD1_EDWTA|nr:tetrathionate reductase complex response regulator [Edwardsiella tarda]